MMDFFQNLNLSLWEPKEDIGGENPPPPPKPKLDFRQIRRIHLKSCRHSTYSDFIQGFNNNPDPQGKKQLF